MAQALTWSGGKAYEYVDGALQEVKTPQTYTMPDGTPYTYNADGIAQALPQGQTTAAPVYQGSAQGIPQWLIDANKGQNISTGEAAPLGGTNSYTVGNQVYTGTQWNGEGGAPWGSNSPGYYNFENTPAVQSASQTGLLSQLNGTSYNTLDANGNLTGNGTWSNIKDDHSAGMDNLVTALVGGVFGAGALGYLGGAGAAAEGAGAVGAGAAGAGTGAGVTGFGDAGLMYGGADAAAAGSLGGGASVAGGAAGGGLAGATAGTGAGVTGFGDAGTMYGGASAEDAATLGGGASVNGGAAAGATALGGVSPPNPYVTGAAGGSTGLGGINGGQVASAVGSILGGSGGAGGSTGTNTGGLGSYIPGLVDAYTQGQASDKMLSWLNGQQAKIDGLYAPGSPEYNYLWDSMSRKDAAAGRNSQYGPRSVDLAARIADTKAQYTSRLATALAGNYSTAFNQDATKYSGLLGALGNNSGNNNLVNSLLRLYNGGTGTTSTGGNAGGYGYGMNDSSLGNINLDEWWA